ncbi:hypothetical protein JK386_08255 [Nocardioides sp. zg-536]|uniref:Nuclear transport factor 2 family protein n=1 Tax=Nocardioides faecalis TaxID=2803858 RepID=A0A939BVF7_9ACTN|nr:hypothetical protein [Nocardioides faecalis]MBM9459896.1 hypothetical protein [Nocardioides faecalis]QVI58872.1 hypothetical protein KG111_00220 [Nocardioides faecalis]
MTDPAAPSASPAPIAVPDPEVLAANAALAQRWLPAFLAGERADEDVYAEQVTTWHNIGERTVEVQRTPSRTRLSDGGADLRTVDVRLRVDADGWVLQATTVGTSAAGEAVRIPVCLVVTVREGRIARFEEYADSAAVRPLLG